MQGIMCLGTAPTKKHIDISFSSVNFIAYFLVFILQLTKKPALVKQRGEEGREGKKGKTGCGNQACNPAIAETPAGRSHVPTLLGRQREVNAWVTQEAPLSEVRICEEGSRQQLSYDCLPGTGLNPQCGVSSLIEAIPLVLLNLFYIPPG